MCATGQSLIGVGGDGVFFPPAHGGPHETATPTEVGRDGQRKTTETGAGGSAAMGVMTVGPDLGQRPSLDSNLLGLVLNFFGMVVVGSAGG